MAIRGQKSMSAETNSPHPAVSALRPRLLAAGRRCLVGVGGRFVVLRRADGGGGRRPVRHLLEGDVGVGQLADQLLPLVLQPLDPPLVGAPRHLVQLGRRRRGILIG